MQIFRQAAPLRPEAGKSIIKNGKAWCFVKYLNLLSEKYPSIVTASSRIIYLEAVLNLPKSTEHFLSDLHGEYESFHHILNSASGVIKDKINDVYSKTLTETERRMLATIIYYPREKLLHMKKDIPNLRDFYSVTLHRLVEICRVVSSKYNREHVRAATSGEFARIIEELLDTQSYANNRDKYYERIIETIVDIDIADEFIVALCSLIKRLAVNHLHIIGDIFDRGPEAELIMDELMQHHSVDIQWGNHDVLWMSAAAGHKASIANVIRIAARYDNFGTIEEGYGINLLPLATLALNTYSDSDLKEFMPKKASKATDVKLVAAMHKAISIIQMKIEGQVIQRRPEYNMESRLLLDKIDIEKKTVTIDGKEYELGDADFPTIDFKDPYKLTPDEEHLIRKLQHSFKNSSNLQRHIRFLYSKGSLYLCYNNNLLFHGSIPLDEQGKFAVAGVTGQKLKGRAFFDAAEKLARQGYFGKEGSEERLKGMDFLWYLWCGAMSPVFGKSKMATFESYFVKDAKVKKEMRTPYYSFRNDEEVCKVILAEFGLNPETGHIVNGHEPVHMKDDENPIKAGGKLLVIDGGLCRAYQSVTGVAGFTLTHNSYGLKLTAHDPFDSRQSAIENEKDIHSRAVAEMNEPRRRRIADTDQGEQIRDEIGDLKKLLHAYRSGVIKEKL